MLHRLDRRPDLDRRASRRPSVTARRHARMTLAIAGAAACGVAGLAGIAGLATSSASAATSPGPVGISVGKSPLSVAADPTTNMVYVANSGSFLTSQGSVSVIDGAPYVGGQPNTGKVVATIPVGRNPWGIGVDPDNDRVYVANRGSNSVSVIDGHTNNVVATIGVGLHPIGVGVVPAAHAVYVANDGTGKASSTVSVISTVTNKVDGSIAVGYSPFDIGVNTISHTVYVGNDGGNGPSTSYEGSEVAVINSASRLVTQIPLEAANPQGVTVDQATHAVFVGNSYQSGSVGMLSVINGATDAEVDNVTIGGNPWGVAVDPTTDRVYLANDTSPGTVSMVDFKGYPIVGGTRQGMGVPGVLVGRRGHYEPDHRRVADIGGCSSAGVRRLQLNTARMRDPGAGMFERFTDRARRVLVLAQEEARLLNHNFIGTEHLLLGLLREGDGVAAKALELLDIRLQVVREKVEETVGPAGAAQTGSPPFTPRAKKVMEFSLREALQLGHNYIGTEHLLLGLVREGEGVAAQVLVGLGADLSRVRQQVVLLMSGSPADAAAQAERATLAAMARPVPRCARCGASLSGSVRYAALEALPGDEGSGASRGPLSLTVFYCARCGGVLVPAIETGGVLGGPRPVMSSGHIGGPAPSGKVPNDPLGPIGLEDVPDGSLVELVYHDVGVIEGAVAGTEVHLAGLGRSRRGSANGTWGDATFGAAWSIGDKSQEPANPYPVVMSGRFGGAPVKLTGEFQLSPDQSLERASLSGDLGGQSIRAEVSAADGGLGTTSAVVAEGTVGGTPFEFFTAFSDDWNKAVVRGSFGGRPVSIDATRAERATSARIVGSYPGEPALLALLLSVMVRFL